MGHVLTRGGFPAIAGATVLPRTLVKLDTTGQRQVVPCTSNSDRPFGITGDTGANPGKPVTVYEAQNIAKAIAGASIGHGAPLAFGSTNGALAVAAVASGSVRHAAADAMEAAQPGEVFSVYVNPRQISGAA